MSKIKSAAEKKRLSLQRDRRNNYSESGARSRFSIRRNKQLSHMGLRRAANEELRVLKGTMEVLDADVAETRARDRLIALERSSFRKSPDAPLGEVLPKKIEKRIWLEKRNRHVKDSEQIKAQISSVLLDARKAIKGKDIPGSAGIQVVRVGCI